MLVYIYWNSVLERKVKVEGSSIRLEKVREECFFLTFTTNTVFSILILLDWIKEFSQIF